MAETKSSFEIQEDEHGVTVKVHLQPRAHRDKVIGVHGDALKVQITAAPVEGQANDACVAFFARALKIPKTKVAIISGLSSREKRVRLTGISRADVEALVPKT
jgi:uncharacterized protein (TIGR00251 family)